MAPKMSPCLRSALQANGLPAYGLAIAVMYRWRVMPGHEAEFAAAWRVVTDAIITGCGSHGSCLHQASDGTFVAYARWPSEAERQACFATLHAGASASDPAVISARARMRAAIAESLPEQVLTVYDDALTLPHG